jgi:hypothetical protein
MSVDAGAAIYAYTAAGAVVDLASPPGLTMITTSWDDDSTSKQEGDYGLGAAAGTVEPQWTWSFRVPSTWVATALALNPQRTP